MVPMMVAMMITATVMVPESMVMATQIRMMPHVAAAAIPSAVTAVTAVMMAIVVQIGMNGPTPMPIPVTAASPRNRDARSR
jgi:hypothetical protein